MLPGISSTTGGRSSRGMREVLVASGGSTPTSIETSGNAAQGGVCTGSVSFLPSLCDSETASRGGPVIYQFLFIAR